ncbi:hypothetical protein [Streptomyces griseoloalbus]|uniref:Isopentenyl diphosphate isomerase/L-lactate dehydrogenase-like FMN-dependent dehydrogenase n=1 Tax=Streptomyces griseoloalbus TaxID=67303 RepID=A0A7W8BT85_9ACTN|nr:hypothetical protein [Streptomyces albaduncus]MBB5128472.1 isopentenyl diphosphate isomerase/L-lactate dehydrogenase-like FMN-dependent dehydrogenase [Streptomyces albaduncus]GGW68150.1 hypothetical protein GCM10010340_52840 [Streptomyces albaduncus]
MSSHATPKSARKPHKRKVRAISSIATPDRYRIAGQWPDRPDRPAATTTSDRKKARALARRWADTGAYVIVQENTGWHVWRTVEEIDGPALLIQRRAAELAVVEDARRAALAAEQRLADADQADADREALGRLMARPPVARDQSGRRDARHITGAQR